MGGLLPQMLRDGDKQPVAQEVMLRFKQQLLS